MVGMSHKPTVAQLAAVMGRTFNTVQNTAASPLINQAEAQVSRVLRRPFDTGTISNESHVLEHDQTQVFLLKYPVTAITALSITSADNVTTTTLTPNNYTRRAWGVDGFANSGSGERLTISYTHGGLTSSEDAVVYGVILSAASRWMSRVLADAFGVHAISAEGSTYTWEKDGDSLTLTKGELKALDPVRRRGGIG